MMMKSAAGGRLAALGLVLLAATAAASCARARFPAACGDGILDTTNGETCDDGDVLSGDGCNALCAVEFGWSCIGSPSVCTQDLTSCGDGIVDMGEDCDDGGESALCDADCSNAACGDGTLNTTAGEECDDGNTMDADGCSSTCLNQTMGCGNGTVEGAEQCDDAGESVTCDTDCTTAACGDGTLNATAGEQCDDGVTSATCDDDCTLALCGDGVINGVAGELCDDSGPTATCDADCTPAVCGDSVVNVAAGEECDDGGASATCDADCTAALCGDSTLNTAAGETCDDGGASPTCDIDCTAAMCGDGTTNTSAGETCDDGGESPTCDINCTAAMCGDGTTNTSAGETCDGPGETPTCDPDCTAPMCGDGTFNASAGEECDDGNVIAGDGCDGLCLLEGCSGTSSLTTTFAGGNGQDGNMFDITALNTVTIDTMEAHLDNGTSTVEIYYKAGSYVGFQSNPGAWTLVGTIAVTGNGPGNPTPIPLAINVTMAAGTTFGWYVTVDATSPNVDYTNGTSVGSVYVSDANIQIHEGLGLGYPFGTTNTPRVWNGIVHYSVCP